MIGIKNKNIYIPKRTLYSYEHVPVPYVTVHCDLTLNKLTYLSFIKLCLTDTVLF